MTTTVWRPPPRSLDDVADPDGDDSYPRHLLTGRETALVLFAAAFWGRQDAYWVAHAGLTGTCVDLDGRKLAEMQAVYPPGWEFVEADAFEYVSMTDRRWDVVSLDAFTNLMDACAESVQAWCERANDAVIMGTGAETLVVAPAGWLVAERRKRSEFDGGVYWTTLVRA